MFGAHPPDQENTRGARWNPPNVAAIYLSCQRYGAIAEGDHAIAAQPLRPWARRFLYAVELSLVVWSSAARSSSERPVRARSTGSLRSTTFVSESSTLSA